MVENPRYRSYRDEAYDTPSSNEHESEQDRRAKSNDPLAELARLIGQEDPFAPREPEHAQRQPGPASHRTAQTQAAQPHYDEEPPAPEWLTRGGSSAPAHDAYARNNNYDRADSYDAAESYERPVAYGRDHTNDSPLNVRAGTMRTGEQERIASRADWQQGNADPHAAAHEQGYADDPRYAGYGHAAYAGEHEAAHDQHYDARYGYANDGYANAPYGYQDEDANAHPHAYEEPPRRRRVGMITVATIVGLALVGTAGAFGYRAFSHSSNGGKPPVIMADAGPNKVVPAASSTDSQSKMIYDRVAERSQGERMVSREEQPVDLKPRVVLPGASSTMQVPQPPPWNVQPPTPTPVPSTSNSAPNSATNNNEPKRVRTVTIRPDQPVDPRMGTGPVRSASNGPITSIPVQPQVQAPTTTTSTAVRTPPRTPSSGPLAIAPQGQPDAAPSRTASLQSTPRAAAPAAADGSYMVQLTSQKTESEAQSSYKALQTRYPAVLGNRQPVIRRADLGDRGVYYRAQIGPFSSADQANEFCGSLKAAGGQCIVQRN